MCCSALQVNLKLFTPAPNKRKTVLLFVFRDRTKTPMERLKETWETDLGRMWSSITKPEQYEGLSLADFFEVGCPPTSVAKVAGPTLARTRCEARPAATERTCLASVYV